MSPVTAAHPRSEALLPAAALTNTSTTKVPNEVHHPLDLSALAGRKPQLVAVGALLVYLLLGIVTFHEIMNLTWASAFYFACTTSLTVGYGDIDAWSPLDNSSSADDGHPYKPNNGVVIFTALYIVGGMVVMGTSLGLLLQAMLERASSSEKSCQARYPLVVSGLCCIACVVVGTVFVVAQGDAEHRDMVHGLYWAIVTISTVGYGSGHPTSDAGRVFSGVFMLVGVTCMGKFVGDLAERPLAIRRRKLEEQVINQYGATLDEGELWELAASEQFRRLGLRRPAGAGVSRDAFCLMMLVRTEKIEPEDLRRCQAAFDTLDADGSGELDMEDVIAARAAPAAAGPRPGV
jgi:hypothetical protein